MKIHFIRHGETDWNAEGRLQGHSPSRLSQKGRAEAHTLSQRLPGHFQHWPIYASDLNRCVETAHILHNGHCQKLNVSPLLREIDLGRWEGQLRKGIKKTEPELFHTFKQNASRFTIDGGESFLDVQQRGLMFVERIRKTEKAKEILVVSHRGLIKSILSFYENRSLDEIWSEPTIPNCAVSTIEVYPDKVVLGEYAQQL